MAVIVYYKMFRPYMGERWAIPAGMPVSDSVKYKFGQFETYPIHIALNAVTKKINSLKTPPSIVATKYTWQPPQELLSSIQSYRDLQINEFKKVKTIYLKINTFLHFLKKIIHRWCIRKSIRNVKNTEDPVTLEIPKKPVYVIDIKQRLSYVYEASTLRKTIENRLLYSEYMFPEVKAPINLLSNKPFTYGQLISILNICKKQGEFSWVLDRFKSCHCNILLFQKNFKQMLKIEAIKSHFKNYKDGRETVIDYFESFAQVNTVLSDTQIDNFSKLYSETPKNSIHPYILKWIALTRDYYIAAELHELVDLVKIGVDTDNLLELGKTVLSI